MFKFWLLEIFYFILNITFFTAEELKDMMDWFSWYGMILTTIMETGFWNNVFWVWRPKYFGNEILEF